MAFINISLNLVGSTWVKSVIRWPCGALRLKEEASRSKTHYNSTLKMLEEMSYQIIKGDYVFLSHKHVQYR
jgi:hypothetical protein